MVGEIKIVLITEVQQLFQQSRNGWGYVDSSKHRGVATVAKFRNGWGYVDSINH